MKKNLFLACTELLMAACNTNSPDNKEEEQQTDFTTATVFEAIGEMNVPGEEPFVKENIRAEVVLAENGKAEIRLYEVSFSPRMPVTIDMVIPGVTYNRTAKEITLSGDRIIPTAGGNAYERYIVTQLQGRLTSDSLIINNNYGNMPTSYRAKTVSVQ